MSDGSEAEFKMITDIEVSNFRGIKHHKLTNLKTLNVIVGPNGTGKTAFLEALFFAAGGSPELLVRTRGWRGGSMDFSGPSNVVAGALWDYTFRDPEQPAEITIHDSDNHRRSVTIEREFQDTVIDISREGGGQSVPAGLLFRYHDGGNPIEVRPVLVDGAVRHSAVQEFVSCHFLGARVSLNERETATLYSNLRVKNMAGDFERALLNEFDILKSLSIEVPHGSPTIFGEMRNGRKLPLSLISGGINHLAGILVRLSTANKSVVIIDEIENGFYHTRFKHIWRSVYDLAKAKDAQVFASTHSLECLQAMANALPNSQDDVSFVRSFMNEDHEVGIEQLSGSTLYGALDIGEVR